MSAVESKVLRIFENNIPFEQLYHESDLTFDVSQKVASYFAESFDDYVLDQIKQAAIREGVHLYAAINVKELANMIKVYDNSEYVKVVRCEKCEHWKLLGDYEDGTKIGYCQKSGIIRPVDYFCADGTAPLEWKEEMSNEV